MIKKGTRPSYGTPEKVARNLAIWRAYIQGLTIDEIAARFEVSKPRVRALLATSATPEKDRKEHREMLRERRERARYAVCRGCGRGFVRKYRAQVYHSLSCYLSARRRS